MKKNILTLIALIAAMPMFAQFTPIFTFGYVGASHRIHDVETFASQSKFLLNQSAEIGVTQSHKGYHLGIGMHTPPKGEFSLYSKLLFNFSHAGGKIIDINTCTMQSKTNSMEGIIAAGLAGERGLAFYGLIAPNYISNSLSVAGTGTNTINNVYRTNIFKVGYGLGAGFFGKKGTGACLDALFNFGQGPTNSFYHSSNNKIPLDLTSYVNAPSSYNAGYVSSSMAFIKFQLSIVIALKK